MKKSQERHTVYNPVSRNEAHLLGTIKEIHIAVFGVEEVRSLTSWEDAKIHNTLRSLEKKGMILRIKRNCYALESTVGERSFDIATEAVKPSYISFWSALSYYGFTEQQVKLIQLVSTKQIDNLRIGPYTIEITTFKPKAFYGYRRTEGFIIAEKEKALVDSLHLPDKCGGLNEFVKCLKNSWEDIDKRKLAEYVMRFGSKSLSSRIGYLVESLHLKDDGLMNELIRCRSESYVKLLPRNKMILGFNTRWKIMVNHEIRWEEIV